MGARCCAQCPGDVRDVQAARHRDVAPPIVRDVLHSPGQVLDPATRAFMEPRFGHDFARVRIHADDRAAESTRAVDAAAYTVGRHVVFGASKYAPATTAGRRMLAHELTHVIQQSGGSFPLPSRLPIRGPATPFEQEAERVSEAVMAAPAGSRPPAVHGAGGPGLQRVATFKQGSVNPVFNLAERVLNNQMAGDTQFLLNGSPPSSLAVGLAAFHAPTVKSAPRGRKRVGCSFDSVGNNTVSWSMRILTLGDWSAATTKARLAALFPGIAACANNQGAATLVVNGMRTNDDQRLRTRTHEDQHVADYQTIFDTVLVPWDTLVSDALKNKAAAEGDSAQACEDALYAAHAGNQTPSDLITAIIGDINQKAVTFHGSPAGRNVIVSNPMTDPACSTLTAEAR